MDFNQQMLTLYFLHQLRDRAILKQLEPVKKGCLYILPRQELEAIINHRTQTAHNCKKPGSKNQTEYELLQWIEDDYYILDYLINKLENEIDL